MEAEANKRKKIPSFSFQLQKLPDFEAANEGISMEEFRRNVISSIETNQTVSSIPRNIYGGDRFEVGLGYGDEFKHLSRDEIIHRKREEREQSELKPGLNIRVKPKESISKSAKKKEEDELDHKVRVNTGSKSKSTVELDFKGPRKGKLILGASGSVDTSIFEIICKEFYKTFEVKAILTTSSLRSINLKALPKDLEIYTNECEYTGLQQWADLLVIAPLSARSLFKIAGRKWDNLLMQIVRDWDYSKPIFVAPSFDETTWNNPRTKKQLVSIGSLGVSIIDGDEGCMAQPSQILSSVRKYMDALALANH